MYQPAGAGSQESDSVYMREYRRGELMKETKLRGKNFDYLRKELKRDQRARKVEKRQAAKVIHPPPPFPPYPHHPFYPLLASSLFPSSTDSPSILTPQPLGLLKSCRDLTITKPSRAEEARVRGCRCVRIECGMLVNDQYAYGCVCHRSIGSKS